MTTFAPAAKAEVSARQSTSAPSHDPAKQLRCVPASGNGTNDDEVSVDIESMERSRQNDQNEMKVADLKQVVAENLESKGYGCKSTESIPLRNSDTHKRKKPSLPKTYPLSSIDTPVKGPQNPVKRRKSDSSVLTPSTALEHAWSMRQVMRQRQQYFEEEREYEQRRKISRVVVPKMCSTSVGEKDLETNNEVATAALQRVLKKEDFKRMEILGQFNLGFIIGKLDNDLYIIDQHASDEKYNYETLQNTTVMHQQPLVQPLQLELTAGEELIILDHMQVFVKNGFTFLVDKNAPATKKLRLLSMPFTKHTQFGTEGMSCCSLFTFTDMTNIYVDRPRCSRTGIPADGHTTELAYDPPT